MIDINYGNKKDNEYLQMIKKCPKTDLHSYAGKGGSVKYISKWTQTDIPKPPEKSAPPVPSLRCEEAGTRIEALCFDRVAFGRPPPNAS